MDNHHGLNSMLSPDPETGLTELEEKFCQLYMTDEKFSGQPGEILLHINYSHTLTLSTPKVELNQVASHILEKPKIKKRIEHILNGRDGQFVYDKLKIMNSFEKLRKHAMGEDLIQEEEETNEEFEKRQLKAINVKDGKGILDSMAKTLGMMQNVEVKVDATNDPREIMKEAAERGKAMRKKLTLLKNGQRNGTD